MLAYLQRRIQQPEYCKSKEKAEALIKKKLGDTPYTDYEVKDLLELNIPYFYQKLSKKHLYNGKEGRYFDTFSNTALEWMKKQFLERSKAKKQKDCDLIRKYLIKKATSFAEIAT